MNQEISSDGIYTTEEMCRILGICAQTLRKMVKEKKIPAAKIGSGYKFCGWQVKEWLNKKAN